MELEQMLAAVREDLAAVEHDLHNERSGRRFIGPGATQDEARKAAGGFDTTGWQVGSRASTTGVELLRDIRAARLGDPSAFRRVSGSKNWAESPDSAGGFLVAAEQLPGYIPARRAASPLRERFSNFDVRSNEVWIVTEGNSVTVQHVAEAATKPDSTGTVAQKISTTHKLAGTSHVSDELLADSEGNAAEIVARQFGQAIGIEVDTAIISGTGTGQPTGIRNAPGVPSTAVDGPQGQALYDSILKAAGRLRERFFEPDTIALHPRDATKFSLAKSSTGEYLFPGGASEAIGEGKLVLDPNIPTNLGAGTNETTIIVGNFKAGGYFFSRQPLTIDASQHAAWETDETVFRAVERYGFAVVIPTAFELLTGVTP